MSRITPVILCGGSGTRLWPASRETNPRQFIPLFGELSTFQLTAARFRDDARFAGTIVIAHEDYRFVVAEQLREIGATAQIVLEPDRRDSAAAVAVAALLCADQRDGIVVLVAADHPIKAGSEFCDACVLAASDAAGGAIMTLGLKPTHAATGFGYIMPGDKFGEGGGRKIAAFIEKPDKPTAEGYFTKGYLWNSGNFIFGASTMCADLQAHAPLLFEAAKAAVLKCTRDLDFTRLDREAFLQAPKVSIDYAVMERTTNAGVLPVSFDWSDSGGWNAVWEMLPHDENGNAVVGDVELAGAKDCLVHS